MATYLNYHAPNRALYLQLGERPNHFVGDDYGESRIVFQVRESDDRDADTCAALCREYIASHSQHDVGMTAEMHLFVLAAQILVTPSKRLFQALRSAARTAASAEIGAIDSGLGEHGKRMVAHIRQWRFAPTQNIDPRSDRLYRLTPEYKNLPDLFDQFFA